MQGNTFIIIRFPAKKNGINGTMSVQKGHFKQAAADDLYGSFG
jgi:hypothetical protein